MLGSSCAWNGGGGDEGDLGQAGTGGIFQWEQAGKGNFDRTDSKSFPPHSSQTPPDAGFTLLTELWGLDVSETPFP